MNEPNSHLSSALAKLDVVDGHWQTWRTKSAMFTLEEWTAIRAAISRARDGEPSAWSPLSEGGLLRGIRHGKPTKQDLAIAESDGDTIRYFCDCPQLPSIVAPDEIVKLAKSYVDRAISLDNCGDSNCHSDNWSDNAKHALKLSRHILGIDDQVMSKK